MGEDDCRRRVLIMLWRLVCWEGAHGDQQTLVSRTERLTDRCQLLASCGGTIHPGATPKLSTDTPKRIAPQQAVLQQIVSQRIEQTVQLHGQGC
ncbi:hypothetical protein C8Q74DRAFT_1235029 [Fomes fomentarius]|nr:hypothetical protein C8Q74DRAFT_1235029 [Fomes fomentarius]